MGAGTVGMAAAITAAVATGITLTTMAGGRRGIDNLSFLTRPT